ncbi:MAG: HAMP domain-containing histidine kinase [Microbacterium sp.]|uniref:Sensor histidine kinase MtrB n=1 Tax=Microbacterium natoriense TaxID=284570 RepID=A0AAW8EW83_9MICO|nr:MULTISPECIES: MtrAB system histidine kinase MtrB [Microbacterium]MBW8761664.1 HAMP domain-containing histidine kinase [Microbacterium sp.]MDQ0647801.1 two-component system sensor histidine kinase MtrB [Microbacterium natoriense]
MVATTATTTAAVAALSDWRGWPTALAQLWRRSLRFRTLSVTLLLTAFAIFVTCVTMALVIQNDLFESRRNEALEDALRAVDSAQAILDSAEIGDDPAALSELWDSIQRDLARNSTAVGITGSRIEIEPDADVATVRLNGFTAGLSMNLVSPALSNRVVESPDFQFYQSVALDVSGQTVPGIIVGQQLNVPQAGPFEVYFSYDLADADQTLSFVQRTLWIAGIGLVAIVAAISYVVLRTVSTPIIEAAETSARLASGDLEVRIEVHGEDELATLGRSFNAMADSIQSQIKELGELSLVQQRFVSDVSHELRTPLTTIRLAADMLNDQREDFDPIMARTAELLHTQVQRFETLLSDLLEISRYDAGSVQLELEATSLAHLAEDMIDQMRPLAEGHGTELRLVAPGGYSPVDMDPRRVRRVLRNLIGNAIEHGEGRPVVVTVDSNQNAVAVGVRDTGLGMEPADAERVFDRFWRADPSRQRTIGGTGLGLSIALGDATLHGGTLAVWSELAVGTNFVLTLPRHDGRLDGPSPIPLEPQDEERDFDDATQPIELADIPSHLFDEGSL